MKCSRFVAALMACVIVIGWFSLHSHQYTFSQVRKDSPADFNFFLNDCNTDELGAMMKALREGGEATTYSGGEGHCARKVKASVSEF